MVRCPLPWVEGNVLLWIKKGENVLFESATRHKLVLQDKLVEIGLFNLKLPSLKSCREPAKKR